MSRDSRDTPITLLSTRIAVAAAAILLACANSIAAVAWQAGYDLNSNEAGFAHSLAGEAAFKYLETGLALGFGAKPFHEQIIDQASATGPSIRVRMHRASAMRLDIPVRLKFGNWPYLFGAFGYERILDVPGIEKTEAQGFSKANDLTGYFGAGYIHWFRNFGIRLEMSGRAYTSPSDKSRYYLDPSARHTDRVTFDTERFGSTISWRAGLRYRFSAPGG